MSSLLYPNLKNKQSTRSLYSRNNGDGDIDNNTHHQNDSAATQLQPALAISVRPEDPVLNQLPDYYQGTQTSSPQTVSGGERTPTPEQVDNEPTLDPNNVRVAMQPQQLAINPSPPNSKPRYGNKKGVTTSWVWSYLTKDETQKVVLCKVLVYNKDGEAVPCNHQFQLSTSTSNLATHLRSQHQIYDPTKTGLGLSVATPARPAAVKLPLTAAVPTTPLKVEPIPHRTTFPQVPDRIKAHSKEKQNKLVAKLVAWMVDDLQPFTIINNNKFREFCQEMDVRFNFPSVNSLNTFTELQLGDFIQSTSPVTSSIPEKRPSSTATINQNIETQNTVKRLKSTSSWVWNHLKKDDVNKIVTCQVTVLNERGEEVTCGHHFQYSTSTSNLASHLRGTHRILDVNTVYTPSRATPTRVNAQSSTATFRTRMTTPTRNNNNNNNNNSTNAKVPGNEWTGINTSLQLSLNKQHPKEKQDRLIYKLVAWMVDDLQPLGLLNNVKFCEFCQEMDPRFILPTIDTVRQIITESANGVQQKLADLIQKTMVSFSFTTESWSQDGTAFLNVTIHWISDKFVRKKALLSVIKLSPSPTGEQIAMAIKSLFEQWNISDKLLAAVTDSTGTDGLKQVVEVERVRCTAHIMQLSVKSGLTKCENLLKKATELNEFLVSRGERHRERFYGIQAMMRADKQAFDPIKQESDNWNSIYLVLDRLLLLKTSAEVLHTILVRDSDPQIKADGNDLEKLLLTDDEWQAIEELQSLLKPFAQVTEFMDFNGGYPPLALMYPTILKLVLYLNRAREKQQIKQSSILDVQAKIVSTMMEMWEDPQAVGQLAMLLDPRFKSLSLLAEKKRDEAFAYLREKVEAAGEVDPPSIEVIKPEVESYHPLAAFFDDELTPSANQSEVDIFLRSPEILKSSNKDALDWWRENAAKFPKLSLQARTFLATPGACVPSERVFSPNAAEFSLMTERRKKLEPDLVQPIMILKEDSILFESM